MTTGQAVVNPDRAQFIIIPLLAVFIALGSWLALLVPFFQGPDEQVHYATLQYWAEPDEKTWPIVQNREYNRSDDIRTYHFSEEVQETACRMQFDEIKWQPTNTQYFPTGTENGSMEAEIAGNTWSRVISVYPPDASGTWSLYYWLGSGIESHFSDRPIFDRIFFARLLSVSIGALIVLIAFASGRKLGWPPAGAALFASLIAFQPMFLATSAVVNIDILLIFAFSLFFYAAILWITDGLTLCSGGIAVSAIAIGLFTKGPGIVLLGLLGLLVAFSTYKRYGTRCRDFFPRCLLAGFVLLSMFFIFTPSHILANFLHLGAASAFGSPLESIGSYLEKTLSSGAVLWTAVTYWGSFGWLDANISASIVRLILAIETIAAFGLLWLGFDHQPPRFLPDKRVLLFALLSIILLQFAIRFFDWRIFDTTGKILIGTPGRYFLPNIIPHFLLVVSGLGYFTPTKGHFQKLVLILSIGFFTIASYAFWFIILPRYYL